MKRYIYSNKIMKLKLINKNNWYKKNLKIHLNVIRMLAQRIDYKELKFNNRHSLD